MIRLYTLGSLELLDANGHPLHSVMVQPKRIALLAYLAAASPRGYHRRDQVLLIFWPDLTEERARNALRQAIHHLRQHLGDDVIVSRGADEIGIREGSLWCDASAVEYAVASGSDAEVVELYRGHLLNGFHFNTASPEFEQWLDERRRELIGVVTAAASRCSEAAERADNLSEAVFYAERAFQHSDGDERLLRRALTLLDAAGEGAASLQLYARFAEQLARQLDTVPSQATQTAVANIRAERRAASVRISDGRNSVAAGFLEILPLALAAPRLPATFDAGSRSRSTSSPEPRGITAARHSRRWRAVILFTILALTIVGGIEFSSVWRSSFLMQQRLIPSTNLGSVSAQRTVALRFYDQGVRALNARDGAAAERLFSAAVDADSTFALAAFSAARADLRDDHTDFSSADKFFRLAARQSQHTSDRDRLMIQQAWADFRNDPTRLALAETLAVRYPNDAVGQVTLGEARLWSGAFLAAIPPLRRAVTLDSSSIAEGGAECVACSALFLQVMAFRYADSLAESERVARAWTVAAPTSPIAWREYAGVLSAEGRYGEARAAYHSSAERSHEGAGVTADLIQLAILSGDLAGADAVADAEIAGGNDQQRQRARWFKIISLRNQGRLHAALEVAHAYRADAREHRPWTKLGMYDALPEAQVLLEAGRPLAAAALFDSISRDVHRTLLPSLDARNRAWLGTLSAEALSAAGDTAPLTRLFVIVREAGSASAFGRDKHLADHIEGLIKLHAGDLPGAEMSFRRAIFSPSMGYTRTNYDLARVLLLLGRPREAIAALQPAFHGVVDASDMYVTRTDIHEMLARAFDMNAQPDSAIAHYAAVVAALNRADSELASRRVAAHNRVVELLRRTK